MSFLLNYSFVIRTNRSCIATSGFHADGLQMTKDLLANIKVKTLLDDQDN